MFIINCAGLNNTGKLRKNNEDNFYLAGDYLESINSGLTNPITAHSDGARPFIVGVYDGMGGENYGEIASFNAAKTRADTMEQILHSNKNDLIQTWGESIFLMNRAVFYAAMNLGTDHMGSTMVEICFTDDNAFIANLGDSRAFILRKGKLTQLTRDHVVQNPPPGKKAPLTQFLGIDPEHYQIQPEINKLAIRDNDKFLLCSDGVTDMIGVEELTALMDQDASEEHIVQTIVSSALAHGGRDNITAIVCTVSDSNHRAHVKKDCAQQTTHTPLKKTTTSPSNGQGQLKKTDRNCSNDMSANTVTVKMSKDNTNSVNKASKIKKGRGLWIGLGVCAALLIVTLSVLFFVHSWAPATCSEPEHCRICGKIRGVPAEHIWHEATCTEAGVCIICGATGEKPVGHDWSVADCQKPSTCKHCGMTQGDVENHSWISASCMAPETCSVCGITRGGLLDHSYKRATCTEPITCERCGKTYGNAQGHDFAPATCTNPSTCTRCGATQGNALDHNFTAATCTNPSTCTRCGATQGEALGHNWQTGEKERYCSGCGEIETILEDTVVL